MIKVEPCKCGVLTYLDRMDGTLTIRTETVPMDGPKAVEALLGGTTLWRIYFLGGRPSRHSSAGPEVLAKLHTEPGERPVVVREHRCAALSWTAGTAPGKETTPDPKGRQEAVQSLPADRGPRSTEDSPSSDRAPTAEMRISDDPAECSECGHPIGPDDQYSAVQLDKIYIWAAHVDCP